MLLIAYQVHWLRAKVALECAKEEDILLRHEMNWVITTFAHKADLWQKWAGLTACGNETKPGDEPGRQL